MSLAYQLVPRPDWAATTTIPIGDRTVYDAEAWARAIFDVLSLPWVKALFGARAVVTRLLRIPPGDPKMLAVSDVREGEALIDTDDEHLRFVAGVRADAGLLHVTTVVRFKGSRGRLYFVPVRFLHDQVTRSMMEAAARCAVRR